MTITIPFEHLNPDIKWAYTHNLVKGIGIDYQYNGLYGYIGENEVEVFSFNNFFKTDNRKNKYNIYCAPTQIVIEYERV